MIQTNTQPNLLRAKQQQSAIQRATTEPVWVKILLITIALLFLGLFLFLPLILVFASALAEGVAAYYAARYSTHAARRGDCRAT
jgi:ABC-type sulfate transport system permease subunit